MASTVRAFLPVFAPSGDRLWHNLGTWCCGHDELSCSSSYRLEKAAAQQIRAPLAVEIDVPAWPVIRWKKLKHKCQWTDAPAASNRSRCSGRRALRNLEATAVQVVEVGGAWRLYLYGLAEGPCRTDLMWGSLRANFIRSPCLARDSRQTSLTIAPATT